MIIFGSGWGFLIPCSILTVMRSVTHKEHGMGSGVLNTLRQLGGALGLAIIGSVIVSIDNFKLIHLIQTHSQWSHLHLQQVNHLLIGLTKDLGLTSDSLERLLVVAK